MAFVVIGGQRLRLGTQDAPYLAQLRLGRGMPRPLLPRVFDRNPHACLGFIRQLDRIIRFVSAKALHFFNVCHRTGSVAGMDDRVTHSEHRSMGECRIRAGRSTSSQVAVRYPANPLKKAITFCPRSGTQYPPSCTISVGRLSSPMRRPIS